MTRNRTLNECLPQLLESVAKSTQPEPVRQAWADHMIASFANAQGRAAAAAEARRMRSEGIRGAIRQAAAPLPPSLPLHHRVAVVHRRLNARPQAYGLRRGPGVDTVRDELRKGLGTETLPQPGYAATSPTT